MKIFSNTGCPSARSEHRAQLYQFNVAPEFDVMMQYVGGETRRLIKYYLFQIFDRKIRVIIEVKVEVAAVISDLLVTRKKFWHSCSSRSIMDTRRMLVMWKTSF